MTNAMLKHITILVSAVVKRFHANTERKNEYKKPA